MTPPTGIVTFLFTDIEGSTRLWEEHPEAMRAALARHDVLLRRSIESHGGHVFKTVGDAFCAAFAAAPDALVVALDAERALAAEPWPGGVTLRVRMALHTGQADERDGDYFGPALSRVARLLAAAHGGQVLVSQSARDALGSAPPPPAALADLGSHRLRDLSQPEHVYQLQHPALAAGFPPLRSLQAFANNLPQQATSFVGRGAEMAQVKGLLSTSRLLTLTGAGGCGKTRLALQAAADLVEGYGDGVWLAELAPLSDPERVPQAAAQALGVREETGRTLTQTLVEHLRPRTVLLILDNCEHLIESCAALADALVRSCPGVRVLATSREALGVAGEQVCRVPSLPCADPERLPSDEKDLAGVLLGYDAVRLFVDRARAHRTDFVLSRGNAPAVAQVCARLDGIPLAVELAAARVRAMPVEQIAGRLDDRFRLLTGGSRTALPRQQTLQALVDWSYDLLTPQEQTLLRRLSLFAGGWTLEAAEAVCAGDGIEDWEVLDLLTSLVDKSLIVYQEQEREGRYRLLETVRQYARERLFAAGDGMVYRARHRDRFLGMAEQAEPQLQGPEQAQWLQRLEREHDNLRAALEWSLTEERGAEAGLRLAGALWRFWEMRGYLTEGRAYLGDALARAEAGEPTLARAKALTGAGNLAWRQGDYESARSFHHESLAAHEAVGNQRGVAAALGNLGLVAFEQGDYRQARALFERSLVALTGLQDRRGMAAVLNNLGMVADNQGDANEARRLYEEALAIKRTLGDAHGVAGSLENLGLLADRLGAYDEARRLLEEGLALRRELGDRWGVAAALTNLGGIARRLGAHGTARELYDESQALFRELGDRRGVAASLLNRGSVAQAEGNLGAARALYEESLPLFQSMGDKFGIALALFDLGKVSAQEGDLAPARERYGESLVLRRDAADRPGVTECLEAFAALAIAQGRAARAARLLGVSERTRRVTGTPVPPDERDAYESMAAAARTALGQAAFAAAYGEGAAMTPEQAVEYALAEDG